MRKEIKEIISKNRWPVIIFLAAFILRLIYILQYKSNPSFYNPIVDEQWHLGWAKEIIGGNFWGNEIYFRGPLYPYFLALLLKMTGSSILWSRILQIIIPSFSAAMIYLLGEKLISRKAGIIAGLALAAYGTMIFYDTMFLLEVLFILLNLIAFYLLMKNKGASRKHSWLLAGFILGLAAITRPNILLLVPFLLIWIYFSLPTIKEIKRRLLIILIYLAGIFAPILCVTARNYIIGGETVLISSQGGVNLYIGNNPDAEGLTMLMPEVRLDETLPWTEFRAAVHKAAEAEAGRTLKVGEESSFWTKKAIDFIKGNPGKFLGLTFRKLVYFFVGFENSDNGDIYFSRNNSSLYAALLWDKIIYFPFGLVLPLGIIGMIAGWKKRKEYALLYIFIIGYIPTVILFLVTARHRLPVIPFILLFAALAVISAIEYIKKRNWRKIGLYAGIFVVLLVLCNRTYFDLGFQNEAQIHFNQALAYEKQGDLLGAEKEYRAALESNPYSPVALTNLGFIQYRQGRMAEALNNYILAVRSDSTYAQAYNNIGLVYESRNDIERALEFYKRAININPDLYQAYLNIGDIYLNQDDLIKAELSYLQAKEVAPQKAEPLFKLGGLYGRNKEYARAEEAFLAGSKLGEPGAYDYINWGNIYYAEGQPNQAFDMYHKGIARDNKCIQAYFNMAIAFRAFNYPPDSSRFYLNKILQIDPQYEPARMFLQELGR
jgi:tetratricopeptide (TPR) repeat protein